MMKNRIIFAISLIALSATSTLLAIYVKSISQLRSARTIGQALNAIRGNGQTPTSNFIVLVDPSGKPIPYPSTNIPVSQISNSKGLNELPELNNAVQNNLQMPITWQAVSLAHLKLLIKRGAPNNYGDILMGFPFTYNGQTFVLWANDPYPPKSVSTASTTTRGAITTTSPAGLIRSRWK